MAHISLLLWFAVNKAEGALEAVEIFLENQDIRMSGLNFF
jgi:hypothetical protein